MNENEESRTVHYYNEEEFYFPSAVLGGHYLGFVGRGVSSQYPNHWSPCCSSSRATSRSPGSWGPSCPPSARAARPAGRRRARCRTGRRPGPGPPGDSSQYSGSEVLISARAVKDFL